MGQGGSKSETTTNVKTKTAVDALVSSIMNCQSNTYTSQIINVSGNYNVVKDVTQRITLSLSKACIQDTKSVADLQQAVANAVKQAAESQSVSVLGALGSSRASVNSFIDNEVSQKITQETIANIIDNTNLKQLIVVSGDKNVIDNVVQEQTADLLFSNSQKVLNELKSVQTIENNADQSAKATQTNFISDIISSLGNLLTGPLVLIALVVIAGMYFVVKMNPLAGALDGDNNNQEGYIKSQQYMPSGQYY